MIVIEDDLLINVALLIFINAEYVPPVPYAWVRFPVVVEFVHVPSPNDQFHAVGVSHPEVSLNKTALGSKIEVTLLVTVTGGATGELAVIKLL